METSAAQCICDHTYFVGKAEGGTWVHNTCVALDTNAIIALLEGSSADQAAVRAAIGGRTPVVSITAAKEFLAGGGDVNALRSFLASNGGRIGAAGDGATVSGLMSSGLKAGDARVVGSAMKEGVPLMTRDKRLLRKIPGIGVGF